MDVNVQISDQDDERYHQFVLGRSDTDKELPSSYLAEAERLKLQWCLPDTGTSSSDSGEESRCSESTISRASLSTDLTDLSLRSSSSTSSSRSFKRSFGKIKELSVLRFRNSPTPTNGCSHCPQDPASQRRAVHELPCGHKWCTQALRSRLLRWDLRSNDFCCGSIPEHLAQLVLRPEEHVIYAERAELFRHRDQSESQRAVKERFDEWADDLIQRAEKRHIEQKAVLQDTQQSALDELLSRHTVILSTAEDKQVKAEGDLRSLQAKEEQDHQTALKYMEAFCAGVLRSGEQHACVVSEQDLAALEAAKASRAGIERKHANAINILRGEQQRRIKMRLQRHNQEVQLLQASQRREELALDQTWRHSIDLLKAEIAKRLQQLESEWDVMMAVSLRQAREQAGERAVTKD